MNISPFLQAAQLAQQMIAIRPARGFSQPLLPDGTTYLPDIIAQATIEERHIDRLEITSHPVEQGAAITDHAFALPSEVILTLGWSNSGSQTNKMAMADIAASWSATVGGGVGAAIGTVVGAAQGISNILSVSSKSAVDSAYLALLDMYYKRAIFTLYTGKRIYDNMICKLIATDTDYQNENSMIIIVECQQIIMVNTSTVSLPETKQKQPQQTASTRNSGTQQLRQIQ